MIGEEIACLFGFLRNITVLYFDLRSDEDEVYFLAGVGRDASEIVEGITYSFPLGRFLVGIFQYKFIGCDGFVGFRLLGYVKVASQYGRLVAYNLLDFLDNQQGSFSSCFRTYMVEVRVDCHEDLPALLVFQLGPGCDTGAGTVPSDESYAVGVL